VPKWQAAISGEDLQCCFLSEDKTSGGRVVEFETDEGAILEWAKCGRFHLGFPQDEEYEELDL
jgi:alpha-acetolactate decarboxylase